MKMPGFTAEASLYKIHNLSSLAIDFGAFSEGKITNRVEPAQLWDIFPVGRCRLVPEKVWVNDPPERCSPGVLFCGHYEYTGRLEWQCPIPLR